MEPLDFMNPEPPIEVQQAMSGEASATDEHHHTWLPVKTVLTGSLILYYDCRCEETISVAEYKRRKLDTRAGESDE